MIRHWQLLLISLFVATTLLAQFDSGPGSNTSPNSTIASISSRKQQTLQIPLITERPTVQQFANMRPTGAAVAMERVSAFTQQYPSDGAKPSQATDVYFGYDRVNLYVVWVCFEDSHQLRAHMSRRENIYDDDYVELTLDTFHDERHGLVFAANPRGIQAEGLWTEGGSGVDDSWDTVWNSSGLITSSGYVVVQEIPFRSLRFRPAHEQVWGVTLQRNLATANEQDFWPWVSARISGRLNQEALLTGLQEISPGRNMQFVPYFSARSFQSVDDRNPLAPRYSGKAVDAKAGLDAKFVLHDSLVLDTTFNPDFSQIESDEPQNTVNQRFEVFFPEKRPFFLENSNFFESLNNFQNGNLLFTRRIVDPEYGVRLTGKTGPWNIGVLFADDRAPGKVVPDNDPLFGQRAYNAIGRISHDIGKNSSVGLIFTDREFDGSFNRVGGLDSTIRLNKNWTFGYRGVVSSTRELDNSYLYGYMSDAYIDGEGRRFTFFGNYQDIAPGFRTELGFIPRVDMRRAFFYYHFYWNPNHKRLVSHGPEMNGDRIWDHSNTPIEYNYSFDYAFIFARNLVFAPVAFVESDTLRPVDFPGLPSNRKFIQDGVGLVFKGSPYRWLTFNTRFFRQGAVNVVVPNGQLPTEGDETSLKQTLTIKPTGSLQIDNTYILDRVVHNELHHAVFNNHIIRSKWNYQFNRELSFRVIAQYNGLLSNPQYSSLQPTKDLNFDFLITSLVHPGTAVYVGYNSNLSNIDPGLCLHIAGSTECDPTGPGLLRRTGISTNDSRQFFVKISYLFRR